MLTIQKAKELMQKEGLDVQTIDWASYSPDVELEEWLKNEYELVLKSTTEEVGDMKALLEEEEIKAIQAKKQQPTTEPLLKQIFKDCRIAALAGNKNSGKTNNLVSLICDLRKTNKSLDVYSYGMPAETQAFLNKLKVAEISQLNHLINKRNCLIILDEVERLKLNDRRYKDLLNEFVNFIYHNNNYVIFCSPNLREFNTIIGGIVEKWLLKNVDINKCVNGSQLKKVIDEYSGKYKSLGSIRIPTEKLLVINDRSELVLDCPYIPEADSKKNVRKLF